MISRAPGPSFSVGKIQKTRDALTGGVEILSRGWLINSSLCLFSFNPFLATLPAAKTWYVIYIYSGHWWKIRFLSMWYQCSQRWGEFCIFNHLSDPVYENQSSLVPVLILSVCIALCYCVFWFCLLTPHSGTFIQDASVILLCRWSLGSVSRIQMMAVFLRAWLCCCWDDSLSSLHLLLWVLMKLMSTLVLPKPSLWCQIRNSSAWAAEWDPPLINPSVGDWLLFLPAWCCELPNSPAEATMGREGSSPVGSVVWGLEGIFHKAGVEHCWSHPDVSTFAGSCSGESQPKHFQEF